MNALFLLAGLLAPAGCDAPPVKLPAACAATAKCTQGFESAVLDLGKTKSFVAGPARRWTWTCAGDKKAPAGFTIDRPGDPVIAHRGATWLRLGANEEWTLDAVDWWHFKTMKDLNAEIAANGRAVVYAAVDEDAELGDESILREVVALMKAQPKLKLRVEAHTPGGGDEDSEAEAAAVVGWLKKHGIAEARLEAKGMANAKPLGKNAEEAPFRDRRIELVKK